MSNAKPSFSQQVKKEITKQEWPTPCCVTAACYGVACFARVFSTKGLQLHTERAYIAQWAKGLFAQAGVRGKVYVRGSRQNSYLFAVEDPYEAEKLLVMFGYTGDEPSLRLKDENFLCEGCLGAFTAAAFVCAGTIVSPEKGYNLEFISPRFTMMQDFQKLLQNRGFGPKVTTRKGANILYFRASEQIEDMLTFMGAGKSTLEIMSLKVYKDLRNNVNRITNCETANIDKTIASSRETIEAIRYLREQNLLETLPAPLEQAAKVRMEYPDLPLAELCQMMPEPVSRSTLSQRFKKIRERAEKQKDESARQDIPG